jgi:hypothetical protein
MFANGGGEVDVVQRILVATDILTDAGCTCREDRTGWDKPCHNVLFRSGSGAGFIQRPPPRPRIRYHARISALGVNMSGSTLAFLQHILNATQYLMDHAAE